VYIWDVKLDYRGLIVVCRLCRGGAILIKNGDYNCTFCVSLVTLVNFFYRFKLCSKARKMHQNVAFPGLKFLNFLANPSPYLTPVGYSLIKNHSESCGKCSFLIKFSRNTAASGGLRSRSPRTLCPLVDPTGDLGPHYPLN